MRIQHHFNVFFVGSHVPRYLPMSYSTISHVYILCSEAGDLRLTATFYARTRLVDFTKAVHVNSNNRVFFFDSRSLTISANITTTESLPNLVWPL
jgi:hypothetical protein